jgi:NAD(P)-dependent dehydrogenase (short-subunit alcohol dehydrogenase family)
MCWRLSRARAFARPTLPVLFLSHRSGALRGRGGRWELGYAITPAMIAQKRGSIVNISSILGLTAFPMRAAYAASKHWLIGLTMVLAVEWGVQPRYL